MAKINLRQLQPNSMVASLKGQKIYLYGSNDCGKTYQSAHLEKPLLLMTEAGGNAVNCAKTSITKWAVFKDIVSQLTSEKVDKEDKSGRMEWETMQDLYSTVIIDTAENLVDLAEKAVCQEFGVRDLSEIEDSKKNGYAIYRKDFKSQIDKLCMYGYTVVFIGHEEYVDHKNADGTKYKYMQPKGSENVKSSTRFLRDLCDFCIALVPNGVDEDGKTIPSTAYCRETKEMFARSRYTTIQAKIESFSAKSLTKAILTAIEKTAESEGVELSEWKKEDSEYKASDWIALIQPYFKAIHAKYPDKAKEFVEMELGEGAKVSKATDDQATELENIYNNMVTFCQNQNIKIED